MIKIEGYKAFRGTMRIVPKNGFNPFELEGEWLYKPDTNCWYCKGRSFAADICEVIDDLDEKNMPMKMVAKDLFELGTLSGSACPRCCFVPCSRDKYCKECGQALLWD